MEIITNGPELLRVIKNFKKNIRKVSRAYRKMRIGYPSGSEEVDIFALPKLGIWTSISKREENRYYQIIYGIGDVKENGMNSIVVATNIDTNGHFRPHGNILKVDNEYYIGHTGSTNRRHGERIHLVSSIFNKQTCSTDKNKNRDLYVIAKILTDAGETPEESLSNIALYVKEIHQLKSTKKTTKQKSSKKDTDKAEEGGKTLTDIWVYNRSSKLVKERKSMDNYTCQVCGFHHNDSIVHVHHINPISNRKEARITNIDELITLCPNCHALAHQIMGDTNISWGVLSRQIEKITNQ